MLSVQTGAAVSTWMFDSTGPVGAAWLRLTLAALVLLILCRPRVRDLSRASLVYAAALGVTSAAMTMFYFGAIDRIPLGTASSLEYLGPFAVALFGLSAARDVLWPVLAAAGVLAVTQPWEASFDLLGVSLGVGAGACLGGYVVLSQRVGDRLPVLEGLTLAMVTASIAAAPFGLVDATRELDLEIVAVAALATVLLPLLPYALEMIALRGMTTAALSTLMSFEPALACLIGFVVLDQGMSTLQAVGVALVIAAGVGAVRRGRRPYSESPVDGAVGRAS
jgi:inner membrane transporter RhtA